MRANSSHREKAGDWLVGVDVGGTFTDFSARNLETGQVRVHKRPSTPDDPGRAVIDGLAEFVEKHDIDPASITRFAHGTTVATNALLQRRGAKVVVVTTRGFRDLLEIGRQIRPHLYDLQRDNPAPLASRDLRFEIDERIGSRGEVVRPLNDAAIAALIAELRQHPEIEGIAVCLLFSYLNGDHEAKLAEALRAAFPDLLVSVSREVQPEFREYERFSTTLINAFLQPEVSRYIDRLRNKVGDAAPKATFGIFQSSGGLMSAAKAADFPVRTALSGPAAGAVGAARSGALSKIGDIITLDIGGTSSDVCLIRNGRTAIARMRDISGFSIRLPMVDIHTIGAGGGSIAVLGSDGLMKVGPESAGAVPGPACYNRGGTLPTVSDANSVLNRLPQELVGGGFTLRRDLAVEALKPVADKLGIGLERAAMGIIDIVNSNIVRAIRTISVEKGNDPRKFALMSFGGAGGLHAAEVARALGMKQVLVPEAPGILCADGLIAADLQEDFVTSCHLKLAAGVSELEQIAQELFGLGQHWLKTEAVDAQGEQLLLFLDMRYVGQNYELPIEIEATVDTQGHVALPDADTLAKVFFATYERNFGHYDPEAPVEIVNARLRVLAHLARNDGVQKKVETEATEVRTIQVWFGEGYRDTALIERAGLKSGDSFQGPAIVTQLDTTTIVPPDAVVRIDEAGNMIMDLNND
ncbi:hydantoinase/oxoprolinase family protein [Nitratireductor luteus]|uniref:hydantoinase/oxoprolinase family protein n=1 Tax=Nitratireductor luteus TaxID=2976980 RepID=UPI0022400D69|nr:hydantoinase/oxoprolinase family protein [Nitratireductor luteus]